MYEVKNNTDKSDQTETLQIFFDHTVIKLETNTKNNGSSFENKKIYYTSSQQKNYNMN